MAIFPANSSLTFKVPTGATTIDSLGCPTAVTEIITIVAYLKERQSNNTRLSSLDAGDLNKIALEGRVIGKLLPDQTIEELPSLPATILSGAKAEAVVGGVSGDFFYEASIPSAFGVDAVLGGKIRGTLVTETAWGNAL